MGRNSTRPFLRDLWGLHRLQGDACLHTFSVFLAMLLLTAGGVFADETTAFQELHRQSVFYFQQGLYAEAAAAAETASLLAEKKSPPGDPTRRRSRNLLLGLLHYLGRVEDAARWQTGMDGHPAQPLQAPLPRQIPETAGVDWLFAGNEESTLNDFLDRFQDAMNRREGGLLEKYFASNDVLIHLVLREPNPYFQREQFTSRQFLSLWQGSAATVRKRYLARKIHALQGIGALEATVEWSDGASWRITAKEILLLVRTPAGWVLTAMAASA